MTTMAMTAGSTSPIESVGAERLLPRLTGLETTPEALSALLEAVASRRDRSAFARLFAYFAPRIKGFIRKRGAEAGQAEEVAQDVLLTVWRRAALYKREQGSVSTWIFTIARNRHIDVIRKERRPEIDPEDPTLSNGPVPEGETILSQAEIASRLRNAIDDLPPEQITVLKKSFFEDKPHSEIASELKLPLGTVKSRVRLALTKLRQAAQDLE